jgi:hypothetical protein
MTKSRKLVDGLTETGGPILRETPNFVAIQVAGGVRITAKDPKATPRARVIQQSVWDQLKGEPDQTFDATVVMELGIGAFQR